MASNEPFSLSLAIDLAQCKTTYAHAFELLYWRLCEQDASPRGLVTMWWLASSVDASLPLVQRRTYHTTGCDPKTVATAEVKVVFEEWIDYDRIVENPAVAVLPVFFKCSFGVFIVVDELKTEGFDHARRLEEYLL